MKQKRFDRPSGTRNYKKLFIIASEGEVTEPSYFQLINNCQTIVSVKCLKRSQSSPLYVLKKLEQYIKEEGLRSTDEAWLVVDVDEWPENDLIVLDTWSKKKENYGLAISNPCFEFWLLLHFHDPCTKNITASACTRELSKRIASYKDCKRILPNQFNREHIHEAIRRARSCDGNPMQPIPSLPGSRVYKLVQKIIGTEQ